MKKLTLIIITLSILLAGCGPSKEAVATQTAGAATAVALSWTATPVMTPSATSTPTPIPLTPEEIIFFDKIDRISFMLKVKLYTLPLALQQLENVQPPIEQQATWAALLERYGHYLAVLYQANQLEGCILSQRLTWQPGDDLYNCGSRYPVEGETDIDKAFQILLATFDELQISWENTVQEWASYRSSHGYLSPTPLPTLTPSTDEHKIRLGQSGTGAMKIEVTVLDVREQYVLVSARNIGDETLQISPDQFGIFADNTYFEHKIASEKDSEDLEDTILEPGEGTQGKIYFEIPQSTIEKRDEMLLIFLNGDLVFDLIPSVPEADNIVPYGQSAKDSERGLEITVLGVDLDGLKIIPTPLRDIPGKSNLGRFVSVKIRLVNTSSENTSIDCSMFQLFGDRKFYDEISLDPLRYYKSSSWDDIVNVFCFDTNVRVRETKEFILIFPVPKDATEELFLVFNHYLWMTLKTSPSDLVPTATPGLIVSDLGRIAFVSNREGNQDIYVMEPDGSNVTRLTVYKADETDPAWSPDGRKIAFTSNRMIYVMNADGSGIKALTTNESWAFSPAWSPDGKYIAYAMGIFGNNDIYVMKADGSGVRNLTKHTYNDFAPAWSPDGNKIAFTTNRRGRSLEIFVMDANGANLKNITNNEGEDSEPAWSPDGNRIAFTSDRDGNQELYLMNADGSGVTSTPWHKRVFSGIA
ncbi:MAG: DUF4352 domain-containing protein [Chloroflexota bacterium]